MQAWIVDELATSDMGDARLDQRYALVLDRLSQRPVLSIPAACEGWAEVQAAYRFFDNDRVTVEKVLAPHRDATLQRLARHAVVLVAQDTTELDLTRKHEKVGGPLSDEQQYGMLVHPLLAMTPQGLPLGVLGAEIWARDPEEFHKRKKRALKPIEEKESFRWLQGYRQACAVAKQVPGTQIVCLSDSEGDIYECFVAAETAEAEAGKADWIIRGCQDRLLVDPEGKKLLQAVGSAPVLKRYQIEVSAREAKCGDKNGRRQARSGRTATVTVRALTVTLQVPERRGRSLSGGKQMPTVTVNIVLVREENPPEGEEPIEWVLLTSLPIDSVEAVDRVVAYYCQRWGIEIYFRVFKSGCHVEDLQLETTKRMEVCLSVYLIVAWRVLHLLHLGLECPDMPCDAVLSPEEWRSVYVIVKQQPLPKSTPTLGEMIPLIASLGGYLGRKHDGPPGPKAMWIGLQRMRDYATCWRYFEPPDKKAPERSDISVER